MAATIVELAALAAGSRLDASAAIERLSALGPVVLLVAAGEADQAAAIATAMTTPLGGDSNVIQVPWTSVDPGRTEGWQPRPGGGRIVDREVVKQLTTLRLAHGADWLIATDESLASARACPGLLVVCVGPAPDGVDPVRPDHQAHSLLDAVRHIEASSAFD